MFDNIDREIGRAVLSLIKLRGRTQRDLGEATRSLRESDVGLAVRGHTPFKSHELARAVPGARHATLRSYITVLDGPDDGGAFGTPPGLRTRNLMIQGVAAALSTHSTSRPDLTTTCHHSSARPEGEILVATIDEHCAHLARLNARRPGTIYQRRRALEQNSPGSSPPPRSSSATLLDLRGFVDRDDFSIEHFTAPRRPRAPRPLLPVGAGRRPAGRQPDRPPRAAVTPQKVTNAADARRQRRGCARRATP